MGWARSVQVAPESSLRKIVAVAEPDEDGADHARVSHRLLARPAPGRSGVGREREAERRPDHEAGAAGADEDGGRRREASVRPRAAGSEKKDGDEERARKHIP